MLEGKKVNCKKMLTKLTSWVFHTQPTELVPIGGIPLSPKPFSNVADTDGTVS